MSNPSPTLPSKAELSSSRGSRWGRKGGGAVLDRIAKAHNKMAKQVALAWLLKRSPVMLPIAGTSSVKHLEENVEAASLRLSEPEYRELAGVPEVAS